MIGPPAIPSLMGVLIPGMAIGIAPINTPSVSPTNMASRLGFIQPFQLVSQYLTHVIHGIGLAYDR